MVVGGSEEFCPSMAMVFDRLYATSAGANETPLQACKPFDATRDGLVVGEGAGFLILEEREHALARGAKPLAEVVGYATNADGAHISHPEQTTQMRVMREALSVAGIDASALGFISGHGTATVAGDVVESAATREVYGDKVPFHTLKGHFGHSLGACGGIEAWLGIEMLRSGWVSPIANFRERDPRCAELDYVGGQGRFDRSIYLRCGGLGFIGHSRADQHIAGDFGRGGWLHALGAIGCGGDAWLRDLDHAAGFGDWSVRARIARTQHRTADCVRGFPFLFRVEALAGRRRGDRWRSACELPPCADRNGAQS